MKSHVALVSIVVLASTLSACAGPEATWQAVQRALAQAVENRRAVQPTSDAAPALPDGLHKLADQYGIEFVYVPAGEFMMGMDETEVQASCAEAAEEYGKPPSCETSGIKYWTPKHSQTLAGFWIGKTEVTNAQYAAFMAAGGYQDRRLWTEAGWNWRDENEVSQPECWDDQLDKPSHPVVCVSWYEAAAYANWLAGESSLVIRLPSEAEWEMAACGTADFAFPWGKSVKNTLSVGLNRSDTAPVGSYLDDTSPYGILDMAGNVSEWTNSVYRPYLYDAADGRENPEGDEPRIVRGGSFQGLRAGGRCAIRGRFAPDLSAENAGFRVAAPGG